jgi:AcrR family transcriptional regulator
MEDTRERILKTALREFSNRGYNAVGVQDICLASGITKPSLYHHFGSKRGLLSAIAQDLYAPFVAEFGDAVAYEGNIQESLLGGLNVFLRWAREEPDFSRLRLSLAFSPPSSEEHMEMRACTERLYAATRAAFSAAVRDHGNMRGRDLPYAASFIGTADAYVGLVLAGALDPTEAFVRRVLHHFMHGIFS